MEWWRPLVWLLMAVDAMAIIDRDHRERKRDRDRDRELDRDPKRSRPRGSERYGMKRKGPPDNTIPQSKLGSGRPSQEDIFRMLIRRSQYSKSDPPMLDKPTEVKLGIYVNSFYSISEQTMDYAVSFYLREAWRDKRLSFEPFQYGRMAKNVTKIKLGVGRWDEIWTPDIFFRNEKQAYFHRVTVSNRMLTLDYLGNLWYVTKISATLSCPMELQNYPLDTQHCPMMFESFGYTMDTMYFSWLPSPVDIDPGVQLPQFTLKDKVLIDCSQNYTAGAFPCLAIQFELQREIGFFLIQIYVPTLLIVILSWVSFWINIDAAPARVSIGLLTVLAMTTQSTGANSSLPKVSYVKAIDVWFSMCLIFVFAGLLEFAVVNVMSRKQAKAKERLHHPVRQRNLPIGQHQDQSGKTVNLCGCIKINIVENGTERRDPPGPAKGSDPEGKSKARRIDKISRKLFPMSFLLFNIIYWIYYTMPKKSRQNSGW